MTKLPTIFLASESPRRKELLSRVGFTFAVIGREEVATPEFDPANPGEYARILAIAKAKAAKKIPGEGLILGCDTIVFQNGELLEKPRDKTEAIKFLTRLQGSWHRVYTGIALLDPRTGKLESEVEMTEVLFGPMGEKAIVSYVESGEPMDKAGAYGIQEKGALLIKEIRGDYFNVVGLPLFRLTVLLSRFNFSLDRIMGQCVPVFKNK